MKYQLTKDTASLLPGEKRYYSLNNYCKDTFIIETVNDLNKDFSIYNKVGVMAGASTPKESIIEVIDYLNS